MTQEDKELLLKDLCGKLPYGVIVNYKGLVRPLFSVSPTQHFQITLDNALDGEHNGLVYVSLDIDNADELKPYLRPMSSMTKEERAVYHFLRLYSNKEQATMMNKLLGCYRVVYNQCLNCDSHYNIYFDTIASIDWLNAHHFDYRGLIKKGLAIKAPKKMYHLEKK